MQRQQERGNKQRTNQSEIQLAITKSCQDYLVVYLNLFRSSHQTPQVFILRRASQLPPSQTGVQLKKTEKVQKCLTKFTRKTPIVLESFFQILLKKRLWHLFSCEFCEISKNNFLTEPEHLFSCNLGDCCFFLILLIFLWPSFHLFVTSYRYIILCQSVLQLKTNFYFFFLKLNLFSALRLFCALFSCSPFLPTERSQTVVFIEKCETLFSRLFLARPERYQNNQDNTEYNSVLPFRIILKIFAVNMLFVYHLSQSLSNFNILSFFETLKSISNTKYLFVFSPNAGKYRRE